MQKTKIVLDADVIIHFSKGDMLSLLPEIFKGYHFVVLDAVYREIREPLKSQLDNQINILKNITLLKFEPQGEERKEYALLIKTRGRGESACLAYCRFNHDVIGSSNLKDIAVYCEKYQLIYLTTLDFLYHAVKHGLITRKDANGFIKQVISKDSNLPDIDMANFVSRVVL